MRIKKPLLILLCLIVACSLAFFPLRKKGIASELLHEAQKGDFEVVIITSG